VGLATRAVVTSMPTPPDDAGDHEVVPLPRPTALGDALSPSLLTPRLLNRLKKGGVRTLAQLLARSWVEVRAIPGLGLFMERELMHALRAEGLHLRDRQDQAEPREVEPADLVAEIVTLGLDERTVAVLRAGGIVTVGDVLDKRRSELLRIKWHGPRPRRGDPATPLWDAYCHGYLPARAESVFHASGLKTVGEVAAMTVPEIEAIPGIGPKTLSELVHGMRRLGFSMRYKRP